MMVTFTRNSQMRPCLFTSCIATMFLCCARAEPALPEPGPENSGMRLRFVVTPEKHGTNESYNVRLDLLNVTDKPITLEADWPYEQDRGDFKEYLESDVSIETSPAIS